MKSLDALDSEDWREAFAYGRQPALVDGAACSSAPFTREDVAEVADLSPGQNDGDYWLCVGRLNDGRWFFLSAGCDYTGWDCQSWGRSVVADSLSLLVQRGIPALDLVRLPNVASAL